MYDTIASPPDPGSLREAVCVLVQRYRAEQEYYRTVAALYEDGDKRQEAFTEYRNALFPYIVRSSNTEMEQVRAILDDAYAQGPIVIMPEG